jgi:hypothetical protein
MSAYERITSIRALIETAAIEGRPDNPAKSGETAP